MTTTDNAQTTMTSGAATAPRPIVIDHSDGAPLSPDDPRVPFARSVQTAQAVIGEVDETNAASATPCPDWDAGTLARHIIAILDRVSGAARGADLMAMPVVRGEVSIDRLITEFDASAVALHSTWSDASLLERPMTLPFGVLPGAAVMAVYSAEILTHSWDLAMSIGVAPSWHDGDAAMAVAVVREGIPAEPRGAEMPFDPVVPVADDAPAIHQLVAWLGRQPA